MAEQTKNTPVLKLEKNIAEEKWIVDNQANREDLLIDETQMKQAVFVHNCENSTLQIKGKVKRIVLDHCTKLILVFDSVVSGVEIYNSQRVQAQINNVCPGVSIANTERCQINLNKDCLECEVLTSCSSLVTVSYPQQDGNQTIYNIPEHLKSKFDGKEFGTEVDKQFLDHR